MKKLLVMVAVFSIYGNVFANWISLGSITYLEYGIDSQGEYIQVAGTSQGSNYFYYRPAFVYNGSSAAFKGTLAILLAAKASGANDVVIFRMDSPNTSFFKGVALGIQF
jgi:hypothetical protein